MYSLIKPLLFSLDPEVAHDLTMKISSLSPALGELTGISENPRLGIKIGSVDWKFPVGLAAGLDKNADSLDFFSRQGFGAVECGTVTLRSQAGNPKPRMFRYPEDESVRNAMGFPNRGLLSLLKNLRAYEDRTPIGVNMGKNKESDGPESINELCLIYETLASHADYFVVNVSSPNTPGLRAFQEVSYLTELFKELKKLQLIYEKDLYLKIAPDLELEKVRELTTFAADLKLTGLIATNTTIMPERGIGGVSGRLLSERAKKIRQTVLEVESPIEFIGVGGITDPQDLFDFWRQGGKAVQIYTSYIYQGPQILKRFQDSLVEFLKRSSVRDLSVFFDLNVSERRRLIQDTGFEKYSSPRAR